jgi:hypothetical protein
MNPTDINAIWNQWLSALQNKPTTFTKNNRDKKKNDSKSNGK